MRDKNEKIHLFILEEDREAMSVLTKWQTTFSLDSSVIWIEPLRVETEAASIEGNSTPATRVPSPRPIVNSEIKHNEIQLLRF